MTVSGCISSKLSRSGRVAGQVVLAAMIASVGIGEAIAKPGSGGSSGSRGTRTYSAPAATPTAPNTAAPIQRTVTPPPSAAPVSPAAPSAARPSGPSAGPVAAPASTGSRFGTGLMAGLLGAGLMGAFMGHGFGGGLGGIMSFFGLILQIALIGGIIMLAVRWFRSRSQPAMAGSGVNAMNNTMSRDNLRRDNVAGASMGNVAQSRATAPAQRKVEIKPEDFGAFEKLLQDIQSDYSREDMPALRQNLTLEMASYFAEELAENARRGLVNRISDVKLLQGDLSEAWAEPSGEYATVAMRFGLTDMMMERSSGNPASGFTNGAQETTEIWTFLRSPGGKWKLSAIQHTS